MLLALDIFHSHSSQVTGFLASFKISFVRWVLNDESKMNSWIFGDFLNKHWNLILSCEENCFVTVDYVGKKLCKNNNIHYG